MNNAGKDEMLDAFEVKESRGETMKAMMSTIWNQKEAILMMNIINFTHWRVLYILV